MYLISLFVIGFIRFLIDVIFIGIVRCIDVIVSIFDIRLLTVCGCSVRSNGQLLGIVVLDGTVRISGNRGCAERSEYGISECFAVFK